VRLSPRIQKTIEAIRRFFLLGKGWRAAKARRDLSDSLATLQVSAVAITKLLRTLRDMLKRIRAFIS